VGAALLIPCSLAIIVPDSMKERGAAMASVGSLCHHSGSGAHDGGWLVDHGSGGHLPDNPVIAIPTILIRLAASAQSVDPDAKRAWTPAAHAGVLRTGRSSTA